ncbi:ArnT family glycosyltransferase [Sporocytophaga myxococcoides]|uniref:ArnT family glycosyltransferase n=1 Tax=Sporocytophaga myxococcoides TaxID=153721 RepID=UPI0018CCB0DE|nr:glycosyltransferase family 39 protein [Sporocytophaga myxococcoides]
MSIVLLTLLISLYHITSIEVNLWDESRLAVNAIEMYQNGNFITTYFDGSPDMWNTKPPFMIWCIVLSMKIFGINEFALRFPSIVSFITLSLSIFWYIKRKTNDQYAAFFSSLVLITITGLASIHVFRTGDYDSMLVLWTTFYCFAFFEYLESNKVKYLNYSFLFFILACLTKGIVACIPLPAIGVYILATRNFKIFREGKFYSLICYTILIILGYYFLREKQNPGYINAVSMNELGGRFLGTIENHNQPWNYYFDLMKNVQLKFWIYFLPLIFVPIFLSKEKIVKQIIYYSLLLSGFYLLIISISQTKLQWYSAPAYPFISICLGLSISFALKFLSKKCISDEPIEGKEKIKQVAFYTIIFGIIIFPVFNILKTIKKGNEETNNVFVPVKQAVTDLQNFTKQNKGKFIVYSNNYNATLSFYLKKLNFENKANVYLNVGEPLNAMDTIIVIKNLNEGLLKTYGSTVLFESPNVKVIATIGSLFDFELSQKDLILLKLMKEIMNSEEQMQWQRKKCVTNKIPLQVQIIWEAGYLMKMNGQASQEEIDQLVNKFTDECKKGNLLQLDPNFKKLLKNDKHFDFRLTDKELTFFSRMSDIMNSEEQMEWQRKKSASNKIPLTVQIMWDAGYLMQMNGEASKEETDRIINKFTEEYNKGIYFNH